MKRRVKQEIERKMNQEVDWMELVVRQRILHENEL
jgi:hypothetical protein